MVMAVPAPTRAPHRALPVAGSVAVLVVAVGVATHGPASGLAVAGLLALLVGILAVAAGRARWAFIADRRTAAVVAAVGVLVFLTGAVVEARTTAVAPAATWGPTDLSP
jgi:MFS superfamily sulfate permease-like transporter